MSSKRLAIRIASSGELFHLALIPGTEPAALSAAVSGRVGLSGFYLTEDEPNGIVVPLTSTLPDGTSLVLHAFSASSMNPISRVDHQIPVVVRSGSGSSLREPLLSNSSVPPEAKSETPLQGLERLSRLATELANERTLLAWIRTCLAGIRTLFTHIALSGTSSGWVAFIVFTEVTMAALIIVTSITGATRYYKIKAILSQKIPPQDFGRFSIQPLAAVVITAGIASVTGVLSQGWSK